MSYGEQSKARDRRDLAEPTSVSHATTAEVALELGRENIGCANQLCDLLIQDPRHKTWKGLCRRSLRLEFLISLISWNSLRLRVAALRMVGQDMVSVEEGIMSAKL